MPKKSKAESYIGFCIKAGKLTCGFNAVELLKKDVFLLLLCDTVSDNGKKSAEKLLDIIPELFHGPLLKPINPSRAAKTPHSLQSTAKIPQKNLQRTGIM